MMRELLTAIGLEGCYNKELELRMRVGMQLVTRDYFNNSACPMWLRVEQLLRALQLGVQFEQPPPGTVISSAGDKGYQLRSGPGGDHRVGLGAQRVYPLRGKLQ